MSAISTRENYAGLIFHAWYLHDGILAGPRSSLRNALALLQGLGIHVSNFGYKFDFEQKGWLFA